MEEDLYQGDVNQEPVIDAGYIYGGTMDEVGAETEYDSKTHENMGHVVNKQQ